MEILVAVPCDATEHVEALRPDTFHEEAFVLGHRVDREVLHTHEDDDGVDRRQISDEMREDVRDPARQLGVDEPYSRYSNKAEARAKA